MKIGDIIEAEVEWPGGRTTVMRGELVALTNDEVFFETSLGPVSAKRETAEVVEASSHEVPQRTTRPLVCDCDDVARLQAELAEARRERDEAYGVLARVVSSFDDGTLEVEHVEVESVGVLGDLEVETICGNDNDACARETCPAIWVVNDAARIIRDAERSGAWRATESK